MRSRSATSSSTAPSRTVTVAGEPVELTAREFDLLAALLAHPGVVLSRDRLLELAWQGEFAGGTRTVDVHVAQLRAQARPPRLRRDRARRRLQGLALMRSLRARLFVAILGTVLVAVGASLALGVVLTKSAVRDTIRRDVEGQAEAPRLSARTAAGRRAP